MNDQHTTRQSQRYKDPNIDVKARISYRVVMLAEKRRAWQVIDFIEASGDGDRRVFEIVVGHVVGLHYETTEYEIDGFVEVEERPWRDGVTRDAHLARPEYTRGDLNIPYVGYVFLPDQGEATCEVLHDSEWIFWDEESALAHKAEMERLQAKRLEAKPD